MQTFLSSHDIAHRLNVPVHRVQWFLRAKHIEPRAKIGMAYGFTDEDVIAIKTAIQQADARR